MNNRFAFSLFTLVVCFPVGVSAFGLWAQIRPGPTASVVYLLLAQLVLALLAIEVLMRNLPQLHRQALVENCYRIDGSKSQRRTRREQGARTKLRSDLWAIAMLVLLFGNAALATVHFYVVPLPLVADAAFASASNASAPVDGLRGAGMAGKLEKAHQAAYRIGPRQAAETARSLWNALPVLIPVALVFVFGGIMFIASGYRRALRELHQGLISRREKNTEMDLVRLQCESDRDPDPQPSASCV